jgi:hypothetical protein
MRTILLIILLANACIGQDRFSLVNGAVTPKAIDFNLSDYQAFVKDVKTAPTPTNAIDLAISDLATIDEFQRPFLRYVWVPDGDMAKVGQVSFAVNTAISHSSNIVIPSVIQGGKLVRWDLRLLAPITSDLTRLITLWEKLADEPYFHVKPALPLNADVIASVIGDPTGSKRFRIGDQLFFQAVTGDIFLFYNNAWRKQDIPAFGSHTNLQSAVILQGLTQSNAPIVRYDWFIFKILSAVDGGLYYDFINIERNPKGKSAQDAWLESLGVSEKAIQSLKSDQRSAIFRSNVTGRPRRIDLFQGSYVRPSAGSGLITITHDIGEGDLGTDKDPIRNLLDFKDKAREVIAERPNGLHIFLLFDGNGGLQNSAPDDIVRDHTIPSPHPARVQPAIGCIRCHGPFEGVQPFANDVQTMLKSRLDIFGDLSSKQSTPDVLDRLAGLYTGDFQKPIRRMRDDYSDAGFRASGGQSIPAVSAGISKIYGEYFYDTVSAEKACAELGFIVPKNKSVDYLKILLPPLPRDITGIIPEDPIIGALKSGLAVNRFQWELVYGDAAFRVQQSLRSKR